MIYICIWTYIYGFQDRPCHLNLLIFQGCFFVLKSARGRCCIYMFWGDFFALWEKFGCVISSQVFCRNVQSGNLDHPFYKEPAAIHQQNLCIWMFGQTYSGEWSETRVVGKTLINFTYVQGATSAYIYILVRRVAFGNGDVAFLRVFI